MDSTKRARVLGAGFLVFASLSILFSLVSEERGELVTQHYLSAMVFAFAGMNLYAGSYGRRLDYWLGAAFVGWYVLSRVLLRELYLDESYPSFVDLSCVYLLAFPFAHVTHDVRRKQGLKAVAAAYGAGYGCFALIGVFASILDRTIQLPWVDKTVGLPGGLRRLYVFSHPNTDGGVFLIALMLCVWLAVAQRRRWVTAVMAVLGAAMYTCIALGVSRTVMLQLCCFAAGLALLGALRLRMARWKRLAVGVCAGVLCAALTYAGFDWVVDGISQLAAGLRASAETVEEPVRRVVWERSLLGDLSTMTGRTQIYRFALELIGQQPDILLRGMRNSDLVRTLLREMNVVHAHSAFLQTLLHMGLPGLALAVWFAVRAAVVSLRLIFGGRAAFADQLLAVALLVLLLSTITEPYLFCDFFSACNMPFFLILGYAIETDRALRA